MSRLGGFIAAALCCAGATLAQAQDRVYRCGPDGRSYSQEPCAGGRSVDVADARSAQQAAQTRQAALRDAREADALQRERLKAERLAAQQGPALIGASKPALHDAKRCALRSGCRRGEATPARTGKVHQVTLYRPAQSR